MNTFKVTVVDRVTGTPVPKALVFLIPGNPLGGSPRRTTGADGQVTFYDGPPILNVKEFEVIAYAPDYYGGVLSVQFSLESVAVTILLEPAERLVEARTAKRLMQRSC